MKLAIVHERLDVVGGAEKVILALHQLYPNAPVYTSFVDHSQLSPEFRQMDIRTSYMQRLPGSLKRRSDKLLPLYMYAFQDFDLSEYDVVLSSSYVAAKSVLTTSDTCHICYCHTPMRFAWDLYPQYMHNSHSRVMNLGIRLLLQYFRLWDVQTSNNVDYFIANSDTIRRRIHKHYRRDAEVIYPPVNTHRFRVSETPGDYYLAVSRLVPYKRIDLAVEAFNKLGKELIVIGTGREFDHLKSLARPNVRLLGWQSDEAVARYLSEARGLIFPGEEDFGILPVEAQAAGTPVIAYGKGGARETVRHGETGYLFDEQTADCLADAVRHSERYAFNRHRIASHAKHFDECIFRERISEYIDHCYTEFRAMQQPTTFLDLPTPSDVERSVEAHAAVRSAGQETRIG